jgi:hypothetical protein
MHELAGLSLRTELEEACDWNSEEADAVLTYVADFLNKLSLKETTEWSNVRDGVAFHLDNVYGKDISRIIINMLEAKAKEIIYHMELPTND